MDHIRACIQLNEILALLQLKLTLTTEEGRQKKSKKQRNTILNTLLQLKQRLKNQRLLEKLEKAANAPLI